MKTKQREDEKEDTVRIKKEEKTYRNREINKDKNRKKMRRVIK